MRPTPGRGSDVRMLVYCVEEGVVDWRRVREGRVRGEKADGWVRVVASGRMRRCIFMVAAMGERQRSGCLKLVSIYFVLRSP